MKISKNKYLATVVSLTLLFTIAVSLVTLPSAYGWNSETQAAVDAGMTWDFPGSDAYDASSTRLRLWERYEDSIPTTVFAVLSPNPVGINQLVSAVMFNPQVLNGAAFGNDLEDEYHYTLDITKPSGEEITLPPSGYFKSDSTGSTFTTFTPDEVGNWTVTVNYLGLFYRWYESSSYRNYYGVTYEPSSRTYTLVVQEEAVIREFKQVPLPTEFWMRPIEGQNTPWFQVASNWLSGPHDSNNGGTGNQLQQDGIAPNSGHILWTKVTEDGGLVGGGNFSVPGDTFNAGHQYQTRFTNPIIMWGRLYYELPVTWSGGGGGWMCVDLKTGEEIWYQDLGVSGSGMSDASFGYYYDLDNRNNHGIVTPGWLFTSNFGHSIHPRYGTYDYLQLTSVPRGYEILGPKGEHLRYELDSDGWLAQWNSSMVFDDSESGVRPANCPITPERPSGRYWNGSDWVTSSERNAQGYASVTSPAYDWNVSAPWVVGMSSVSVEMAVYNDVLFGINGTHRRGTSAPRYDYESPVTIWAVSLKPGHEGSLLYMKNIDTVFEGDSGQMMLERVGEGVAVFAKLPERYWVGYDIYTGNKLWDTSDIPESEFNPFGYFSFPSLIHVESVSIAYGKLFTGGYTGAVMCYDVKTGDLLWRYEAPTNQPIFEYYTLMLGPIADGKIYVGTHEHSADTPLFKGAKTRCLNITTGEPIWEMTGWAHPYTLAVADGVLIYWNNYDHQVYAVGKGPSSTTVTAGPKVSVYGSKVLVEGSVTDVSAGTKQVEQAARFPNGVPAVSDASMSDWMAYVYMQKPKPADATGVEVIISVLDPNNNCYEVARTTSDASGFFSVEFEPEVPGKYTVVATFAGSESYWQSSAETAVFVEEAPAATPVPTAEPAPMTDTYVLGFGLASVIAIVVIGLVLIMMLRKR